MFIMSFQDYNQTEKNTKERKAAVEEVIITDNKEKPYIKIYTKEYETSLMIPECMAEYSINDINELKKGDRIVFRVDSFYEKDFYETPFADVVSLSIEGDSVYSLEEYNTIKRIETEADMYKNIIVICLFFSLTLIFGILVYRDRKVKKS